MLQKCLPEKVLAKYSEALARDALQAAQVEGMVACYHCSAQVQLPVDAGEFVLGDGSFF